MFEFDPDKSVANKAKHGIDFVAAQALWLDPDYIEAPLFWLGEDRWMAVGMIEGKLWSAVITYRESMVRIISVRRSRPREAQAYDKR